MRIFALPDAEPFMISEESFAVVDRLTDLMSERALRRSKKGDSGADKTSWPWRRDSGVSSGLQAQVNGRLLVAKESSSGSGKIKTLSVGTTGIYYIYRFDGLLLAEYDGLGACLREFIYIGAKLVAEYQPLENKYYYHTTDQINSTRIVTDDNGTVVYAAAHDPYGGIQQTWVNTFDPALKFSGKERDEESGLDYFGARYYDHTLYRFLSVDPVVSTDLGLANPQFWNSYSYCGNNPLRFFDKGGRSFLIFIASYELLFVFTKDGNFVGVYSASNNTAKGHEPFPEGIYGYHHHTPHPYNSPSDAFDHHGFFGFATNQIGDQGIHGGREGCFDGAGGTGWKFKTKGCIRTTSEAMHEIYNLHFNKGDPLEFIICIRDISDVDIICFKVAFYLLLFTDKDPDTIKKTVEQLRSSLYASCLMAAAEIEWMNFFSVYFMW